MAADTSASTGPFALVDTGLDVGPQAHVTAVAVSPRASDVYVGLSSGSLRACTVREVGPEAAPDTYDGGAGPEGAGSSSDGAVASAEGPRALELRATRPDAVVFAGRSVVGVAHLGDLGYLAVLCGNQVHLVSCESLGSVPVPGSTGATALAGRRSGKTGAAHVAVALRESDCIRVLIYRIWIPKNASAPTQAIVRALEVPGRHSARSLLWTDRALFIATRSQYYHASLETGVCRHLFSLRRPPPSDAGSAAGTPVSTAASSTRRQRTGAATYMTALPPPLAAALVMDDVVLMVDADGAPVGGTLPSPSTPTGVVASGRHVLTVSPDGIFVSDGAVAAQPGASGRAGGAFEQTIPYGARSRVALAQSEPGGGVTLLGAPRGVWAVLEVPPAARVRAALRLADAGDAGRAADTAAALARENWDQRWAPAAMAHAQLIAMQAPARERGTVGAALASFERQFRAALDDLAAVPAAAFQPGVLLRLLPGDAGEYLKGLPQVRLFGAGRTLTWQPLREMILLATQQAVDGADDAGAPDANGNGPEHAAAAGNGAVEETREAHGASEKGGVPGLTDSVAACETALASYLLRVRDQDGVACLDAIDTVLVALLSRHGRLSDLRALLSGDARTRACAAPPARVAPHLASCGMTFELGTQYFRAGDAAGAIAAWKAASGDQGIPRAMPEPPNGDSASEDDGDDDASRSDDAGATVPRPHLYSGAEGDRALRAIASALSDLAVVDEKLARDTLPWLAQRSGMLAAAAAVCRSDVTQEAVLEALVGGGVPPALRLAYVYHKALARPGGAEVGDLVVALAEEVASRVAEGVEADDSPRDVPGTLENPPTATADAAKDGRPPLDAALAALSPWARLGHLRVALRGALLEGWRKRDRRGNAIDGAAVVRALAAEGAEKPSRAVAIEGALAYALVPNHAAALQLLVSGGSDGVRLAEQYCRTFGKPPAGDDLLNDLQEILLGPQGGGGAPRFQEACRLIAHHGRSLDPRKALEALGEDTPLLLARSVILQMLQDCEHRMRQGQVLRNLYKARALEAQEDAVRRRRARVLVSLGTTCFHCGRVLGDRGFVRVPNGKLYCIECHGPGKQAQAGGGSGAAASRAEAPAPATRAAAAGSGGVGQAAPARASSAVDSAAAGPPKRDTVHAIENQRYIPLRGWGGKGHLLRSDRPPYSHDHPCSGDELPGDGALPPGWGWAGPWRVDMSGHVGAEGWVYGTSFRALSWPPPEGSGEMGRAAVVRRRRWVRQMMEQR
ncbi:unnamed protein product [Pedinophyceae sp. YPF-701]|nr:unnamed protein product [Pedinophyceae sp. YPF-701]